MIIAQLTDLHIGFDGEDVPCKNTARLRKVIKDMNAMTRRPDLLILTGDLVETGENWAYEKLRDELAKTDLPVYFAMGNHDDRAAFTGIFPDAEFHDGFLQYTIEDHDLRIIVLDTLEPGRHGGAFCEKRAAWLENQLTQQPERPTLLALHHPPIETGIGWMTAKDDDGWVVRLRDIVERHDNIVHIISGHIHRSIFKQFGGTAVSVSRAVAPQLKLDLAKIKPDAPDNRVLIIDAQAGYSLHLWENGQLTTHNGLSPDGRPIISYTENYAFFIRQTMDMPPKGK